MEINRVLFGKTTGGQNVDAFTLTNKNGMQAVILNYGGIVNQLWVPDRDGKLQDVVLGYTSMPGILADTFYMGAIVGRYGNRIARGKFNLDGKLYQLACNNGVNHLHGGINGFDKVLFKAQTVLKGSVSALRLTYLSQDGEEGYPGNLSVTIDYTLAETNALTLEYTAHTDKRTVVNLTNHMYFNMTADYAQDILKHELQIKADLFTPTDSGSIPTGELLTVKETPLDFSNLTSIGNRINDQDQQMLFARGYDHNFVLNKKAYDLDLAAKVYEPESGRVLEIYTTEPAVQFYSGNFLDGSKTGKNGQIIQYRHGFCLEPQHFPDSPNQPDFPSTTLDPGQTFHSKTNYRFSVEH